MIQTNHAKGWKPGNDWVRPARGPLRHTIEHWREFSSFLQGSLQRRRSYFGSIYFGSMLYMNMARSSR
jgi:hypothetical protein